MTLDSLDVKQMKLLLALLQERNLTRVATKLSVSQQAVSEQLRKLRLTFADQLFVRIRGGVEPTAYAERLGEVLTAVVQHLEHLQPPQEFEPQTVEKPWVVAANNYAQQLLGVRLAKHLEQTAPGIALTVEPLDPTDINQKLQQGQVDLAISYRDDIEPLNKTLPLLSDPYCCIIGSSQPMPTPDLASLRPIIYQPYSGSPAFHLQQWFAQQGCNLEQAITLPCLKLVLSCVQQTETVSLIPKRLLPNTGVIQLPTSNPLPTTTLVAAWHPRLGHDPLLQWQLEQLKRLTNHPQHQEEAIPAL